MEISERDKGGKPSLQAKIAKTRGKYRQEEPCPAQLTVDGRLVRRSVDDRWRQRLRVSKIMERLQHNALGLLQHRGTAVDQMMKKVFAMAGFDYMQVEGKIRYRIFEEVCNRINNMEMSMPQVRSAEVVLKKIVPDLAQVEYKSEQKINHVVFLPERAATADAWAANARNGHKVLEHDGAESRLAAAIGSAEPAAVVPD